MIVPDGFAPRLRPSSPQPGDRPIGELQPPDLIRLSPRQQILGGRWMSGFEGRRPEVKSTTRLLTTQSIEYVDSVSSESRSHESDSGGRWREHAPIASETRSCGKSTAEKSRPARA